MKLAYLVDTDWIIDHFNARVEVRKHYELVQGLDIVSVS